VATENKSSEKPKRHTKTDSARKLALTPVKILLMNANGEDDKGGSATENGEKSIQNVEVKHVKDEQDGSAAERGGKCNSEC
jgi:hypothetical protein